MIQQSHSWVYIQKKKIVIQKETCTLIQKTSQDGRVEGHTLIFSYENSQIATCSWTIINTRMLDPTKKRCLMSKDKEEVPTTQ